MKIGIVLNPKKIEVYDRVEQAINWLVEKDCEVYVEEEAPEKTGAELEKLSVEEIGKTCEVVIVFGGDGSILRIAAQLAEAGTPILGINSGQLGFLTETTLEGLETALPRIINNKYKVSERSMLRGQTSDNGSEMLALNDMVLSREKHGRVVEIEARVNDDLVTRFVCDGILISTPTGSTAYNLAANGPIVHPEMDSLILNPICPHTLTNRPLILPPDSEIELELLTDDRCHLIADGQKKITNLSNGDIARVRKADCTTSLIVPPELSFYELLASKLQWSGRT